MRSFCSLEEEEEEDRFFDTREDITSVSDSGSDCPDNVELGSSLRIVDLVSTSVQYDLWTKNPDSVNDRRSNFFKWLGMSSDEAMKGDSGEQSGIEFSVEIGRTREDSGAVLANSDCEVTFSSSRSSMSCCSSDTLDSSERGGSEANFVCRIKNLDDGTEFVVDRLGHDGMLSRLREVGSNRLLSVEEFQNTLGLSPLVKQFMCREADAGKTNSMETTKRAKRGWLKRLGAAACIVDMEDGGGSLRLTPSGVGTVAKVQRVRVHSSKKRSKELSALYTGQEIQAHKGTIRTMRFSPDGCYLATAGEDRSVRVWQVLESERSNDIDIPDIDPSRLYFMANQYSELAPISSEKEKSYKVKNLRRTSDSSCVIFPPRVFRLSEKPLHEFYGHSGEILDLSWSNHMHLLSSSVDKTVRLWRVGCDQCLRVFSHNNYVTCIQFNPVDDNYFISGSIDGKVRIWDVPGCRVVDWTDVKEIVTALCYRPDGKGAIVGSMGGNCRFYNVTDNHLLLDGQICIQGKKKSPGKRITGFQFSPSDPSKLMVTSADSQVRILSGVDVICKYKGLRNAGSQISASFTVDGKHIVSASEDSNVYVWNYSCQDGPAPSKEKSIQSYERFFSDNVSVAVPWCVMRNKNSVGLRLGTHLSHQISVASPTDPINGWHHYHLSENSHNTIPLSPPDCLSLHQGFFSEALPKGSATWPEEKLPSNSPSVSSVMCKTQYKFLKSFYQSTSPSHAWGHVIVTGGWDGRIRSFHNYGLPVHT